MDTKPKIISADTGEGQKYDMFGPMPCVTATFDDGTVKVLFSYYPDELSFTAAEFIGLTEKEAHKLRQRKDVAYLQS